MKQHVSWKTALKMTITFSLAASLILSSSPVLAASKDVQEQTSKRTILDVKEKWKHYLPQKISADQWFDIPPGYIAPHQAGKASDKVLQDGLNATNFARYLAGLPDDVTLDYALAEQQQAGAVLMSELGTITHYPKKPANMDQRFFEHAETSAGTSNLSAGRSSLYHTVFFGYMADNSASNLETVGHRRWIINPQMKQTMFGLAYNPTSYYDYYSTMLAFNTDRSKTEVTYDYIAWPSAGVFPTEILSAHDPWSITLNPERYKLDKTSELYVTMKRESDGKQWKLDSSSQDKQGDFFKVELNGYGVANAIIFRPSGVGQYIADDVYEVTLHNVYTNDGRKTSIAYTTTLFNLQSTFQNSSTRYAVVGQKLKLPVTSEAMQYESSAPDIASVDKAGVITMHKEGNAMISVDNYITQSSSSVGLYVIKSEGNVSEWAKGSILRANELGILSHNPYQIDVKATVTRSQFVSYVTSLLRGLNIHINDSVYYGKTSPFDDVGQYDNDVLWAYENGIVNGIGNRKFSPNQTITREQAATLLLNVYNYLGGNEKTNSITPFNDQQHIADWAKHSVKRISELSIMDGVLGHRFDPKGNYTHEQTIVTMLRLHERFD